MTKTNRRMPGMTRRAACAFIAASAASSIVFPTRAFAASRPIRRLSLHNLQTNEYLETIYWEDGYYEPEALHDINRIMRDHHNGKVKSIDLNLLDLLHDLRRVLRTSKPISVISAYRTKATNDLLRREGFNAVKHSLHIKGKAVDIRVPGRKTSEVRRAAHDLRRGGVGYYPKSEFVHVDVGPVRYW